MFRRLWSSTGRTSKKKSSRRSAQRTMPRFSRALAFENLEHRDLLAAFNWVLAGDGVWGDANNWINTTTNNPGVPGPNDDANIPGGRTVTTGGRVVNSVNGAGQLNITGGTFVIKNVATGSTLFGPLLASGATLRTTGGTTGVIGGELSGTIETTALGTFRFQRGLINLNPGASLTGAGQYLMQGDVFGGPFVNLLTDIVAPTNFLFLNGEVGGSEDWTIGQTFDWTGGTFSGTGQLIVQPSGVIEMEGGATRLDTRTLINQGTINFEASANLNLAGNATLQNNGLFDFQNDTDIDTANGPTQATFVNTGTIRKSGGTGQTGLVTTLVNTGVIDVQTGQFTLVRGNTTGGTFTVAAGSILDLSVGGQVFQLGGTVALAGAGTVLTGAGEVEINGGGATVTVPGTLAFQHTGGTLTIPVGTQFTVNGRLTLAIDTQAILRGGGTIQVNGPVFFDGEGTLFINGDVATNTVATTWNIPATRVVTIRGNGDIQSNGAGGHIVNAGSIRKQTGDGLSTFGARVTNTGTLRSDSGTLAFRNTTSTGGSIIAGASGVVRLTDLGGATFTQNGTLALSGAGVVEIPNGAFIAGAAGAQVNVAGATTFRWNGGTVTVPVGQNLTVNGALNVGNADTVILNGGGTLVLNGNVLHSGEGSLRIDGNGVAAATTLRVNASRTYNIASDADLVQGFGGGGNIQNLGTIRKSAGAGTSFISAPLAQAANLNVDAGTLQLQPAAGVVQGGQFQVAAGAILNLTGGNTTTTMSGNFTGTGGGEVRLTGGTIVAEGGGPGLTFNFPAGLFRISGGVINTNAKTVTINGQASFVGATDALLTGSGELLVGGLFEHSSTERLAINNGTMLHIGPAGTYRFRSDGDVTVTNFGALVNEGVITKNLGTGESVITGNLSNQGTIESRRGTVRISGTISEIVAGALTGGKWGVFSTATTAATLNLGTAVTAIGLEATVIISGPNSSLPSVATVASNAGVFNLFGDASFILGGSLTNTGFLTLSKGSVLDVTGTFTQTAGGKTTYQMNNGQIGKVRTTGDVSLAGQLAVTFTGTPPAIGTNVFIVENTGAGATTGTYAGLAQNALINFGGMSWRINYIAGAGGNDVRLQRIT